MSDHLVARGAAERELVRQAEAIAIRLGHRLMGWVFGVPSGPTRGMTVSRCSTCGEHVIVRAQCFTGAPISGEAVTFPCRKPSPPPKRPEPAPIPQRSASGTWSIAAPAHAQPPPPVAPKKP